MQAEVEAKLTRVLSQARLEAYRRRLGCQDSTELFSRYVWNMSLSESFYPGLQVLEVVLRNSLDHAIADHFGSERWFEDRRILMHPTEQDALSKATAMLQKRRKPLEVGRIIAEFNFGYWTSLLARRYERVLWPRLLKKTFPYMPRRNRTREIISSRLNQIRALRNRIFHHEPICHWTNLIDLHQNLLETIAWIEPAAKDLVTTFDRFPDIHQAGLNDFEVKLRSFF